MIDFLWMLFGIVLFVISMRFQFGYWSWQDPPDTRRLNQIEEGYCVNTYSERKNGEWVDHHWRCTYSGNDDIIVGTTLRKVLDKAKRYNNEFNNI